MAKREAPLGVKILSVLSYIASAFLLLFAILALAGSRFISEALESQGDLTSGLASGLIILIGIILLAFAVLDFFIGRGLWHGQNWARVVSVILLGLGMLGSLGAIIQGAFGSIISLIVYGLIGYYLIFDKQVKKFFDN